jgi:hypothetical protein
MDKKLTDEQLVKAAREAGIEPAALKAFAIVESAGNGFLPDGRPKILFEGHIFYRQLKLKNIDPAPFITKYPDIVYPKWDKTKYKGGTAEYDRLKIAESIDKEAAWKSTSWGMFQIMGFNHKICDYDNVFGFVAAMAANEYNQLLAAIKLIKAMGLISALKQRNWVFLASRYNGPLFRQNQYDEKLENAYQANISLNNLIV